MNKITTYSFQESFLDNLTDYIEENYIGKGRDLSRIAVVFGGKRPSLFMKRNLARRLRTSFYPPKFFTIDEFVGYALSKQDPFGHSADLDHCYLIYKLAQKNTPQILQGRETFAQFLPWTREILAFIEQLDLEYISDDVLAHIESNARIGYAVPQDINRLLESIVALRKVYHEALREQKTYSRGFQYLWAAQVIGEVDFDEFDQILFCNFFYFNRSEEIIIKNLYERDKAALIFQGDQRRWPVLKRIANKFSCCIEEADQPYNPAFHLNLYCGFDIHSQVGVVREILKSVKRLDNTVIVLPNPDNLIPLLSEITNIAKDFNISMGYPLKRSSLYSLFEFIFKTQLSKRDARYYAKDYLKTLRHPFVKNLKLTASPTVTRILIHKIEEILTGKEKTAVSGSIFIDLADIENLDDLYILTLEMLKRTGIRITRKELQTALAQLHELLFHDWEKVHNFVDFTDVLGRFLDVLVDKSFLKNYPLNLNIAAKMYAIKDEFQNASFHREHFPQEELFKIFESKIAREMGAFSGSPLKGLQILGLFETRSLNFENVIVLDVNEGMLPHLNIYEPLIPREVMINLNLDRLELEEEIQRYHFMRLISSAKNVHLVYQQSKDKEKSRFVEELIWEEQKKRKVLDAVAVIRPSFEVKVAPQKIAVRKTPAMIEFLKNLKYSASSINAYVREPLEFYYNYVLGMKEREDLLDEPEARHVGTFVHELLEECFKPFLKKKPKINAAFRGRFTKMFDEKFETIFSKSMKSDSFLLKSVMAERLNRFLDNEEFNEDREVAEILYLENRFEETITLPFGEVRFKYIVDRIDRLKDGTVMLIDYKTGSMDQMPKAIDRIAAMDLSRETVMENVKSFQIPLYFHYLQKQFQGQPINAALYNLRTLKVDKFIDQKITVDHDKINQAFLRALDFIITEICDPDVDFVSDERHVRYH